jgi:periplasmic protein CpxP/Spy
MKSPIRCALTAAMIATAALGAYAQTAAPAQEPPHTGMHAPMRESMQQHRAQRLASLKAQLKLSAEQEGAWNNYAQAMSPPKAMGKEMNHEEFARLTTPERLDRMKQMRQDHAATWEQRDQTTRALYSALTVEQKKIFDRETLPHGHGHHRPEGQAPH